MESSPRAFTLIELLVVVAIIGILAALLIAGMPQILARMQNAAATSSMRTIGVAFRLYAADHDNRLPGRVTSSDKWPALLAPYLDDTRVYVATGDKVRAAYPKADLLSNTRNNTSFIMNGYNDIGAFDDESVEIRLSRIDNPSQVILLGTPVPTSGQFYMDMREGNQTNILDLDMYNGGSPYLFTDGSARFLKKEDYDVKLWLIDKDYQIP